MQKKPLEKIAKKIAERFEAQENAREKALALHRDLIRSSGQAIRATHRGEFKEAKKILANSNKYLEDIYKILKDHPEVYYAGFIQDAQKEYAESIITLALISGEEIPEPDKIKVDYCSYLNGMAEAVGELRRYILDLIRQENVEKAESFLEIMDDIYYVLVSMDYSDAITRGLRRSTDVARSLMEKTRADITSHAGHSKLKKSMNKLEKKLEKR